MRTSKIIRCVACARRIRDHHPHIGVEDYETSVEFAYHAHRQCMERAAQETAMRLERGKVYFMHHYHVPACDATGFDCSAGCFAA